MTAKPKDDELIRTTIRLPQSMVSAAKHRAIDEGITLQDLITRAVEQYLAKKGGR